MVHSSGTSGHGLLVALSADSSWGNRDASAGGGAAEVGLILVGVGHDNTAIASSHSVAVGAGCVVSGSRGGRQGDAGVRGGSRRQGGSSVHGGEAGGDGRLGGWDRVGLGLGDRTDGADGGGDGDGLGGDMGTLRAVGDLRGALGNRADLSGVDGRRGELLGRDGDRLDGGGGSDGADSRGDGNGLSRHGRTLGAVGDPWRALGNGADESGVDGRGGQLLGSVVRVAGGCVLGEGDGGRVLREGVVRLAGGVRRLLSDDGGGDGLLSSGSDGADSSVKRDGLSDYDGRTLRTVGHPSGTPGDGADLSSVDGGCGQLLGGCLRDGADGGVERDGLRDHTRALGAVGHRRGALGDGADLGRVDG